jgi:hypothetical protein
MTLRYLYNGVEQTNTSTRIKGPISSITDRADGDVGSGEAIIKDPTGALTYDMLRTFRVVEDACVAAPILHDGMIYDIRVGRGDYVTGPGREWTIQFTDLNGLLHERVLYDKHAKRKRETGDARMAWLMASRAMAGLVYDNGAVGTLVDPFDEADFRGQFAEDVLQSLMPTSIMDEAKVYFVYMDQASQQPSLFLQAPTATIHTSSLGISNVPGDYDGVSVFYAVPTPEAELLGNEIYDGVYFTTKNGSLYRQRPATYTHYPRHRDGTFSTERISLGATATRHADMWLAFHSVRRDTITCTVRLPRDKVGLIQAGDRLQVRFAHLPGYESWTWTRVTARTFPVSEGFISHYDVQLELSTRGIFPGGGFPGGTAKYPKQPPDAVTVVQSDFGIGDRTLPSPATAGNTLAIVVVSRGNFAPPPGYDASSVGVTGSAPNDPQVAIYTKAAVGGEQHTNTPPTPFFSTDIAVGFYELSGEVVEVFARGDSGAVAVDAANSPISLAGVPVAANGLALWALGNAAAGVLDSGIVSLDWHWAPTGPPPTQDFADGVSSGWPGALLAHSASPFTPAATWVGQTTVDGYHWSSQVVVFANTALDDDPPEPGQHVENEIPTPAPDGVTTTFTVRNAYVPHSLKVKVDGVPILNGITETDPENGAFALDFAPVGAVGDARAEIVTVDYQAV